MTLKDVLFDPALSLQAKGLYVILMRKFIKEKKLTFTATSLQVKAKCGREAVASALYELVDNELVLHSDKPILERRGYIKCAVWFLLVPVEFDDLLLQSHIGEYELSLKAQGLYSLLLYNGTHKINLTDLEKLSTNKLWSFRSAITELKKIRLPNEGKLLTYFGTRRKNGKFSESCFYINKLKTL